MTILARGGVSEGAVDFLGRPCSLLPVTAETATALLDMSDDTDAFDLRESRHLQRVVAILALSLPQCQNVRRYGLVRALKGFRAVVL